LLKSNHYTKVSQTRPETITKLNQRFTGFTHIPVHCSVVRLTLNIFLRFNQQCQIFNFQ